LVEHGDQYGDLLSINGDAIGQEAGTLGTWVVLKGLHKVVGCTRGVNDSGMGLVDGLNDKSNVRSGLED